MTTDSSKWPGEWHPGRNDVALASEAPDPAHLADFKTKLLASDNARGIQNLMHIDLSKSRSNNEYTYPLALLSDLPPIPEHFELLRLWEVFLKQRNEVAFVNSVPILTGSRETVAPHLLLAGASFALLAEGDAQRAKETFIAAINIWSVMIEIDNREARTEESLVAGTLLFLYSCLDSDAAVRRWTRLINYAITTASLPIARRRRLHDYCLLDDRTLLEAHRSTIATLWLADLLQALHLDAPLNFSTQEVAITMINSSHSLQDLRFTLLRDERLPLDVQSREDAILLLIALLTDAIYLQRSLGSWSSHPDPVNPFVPLSPHTEQKRMLSTLISALDRWSESLPSADPDVMVLYHYVGLYLTFPAITGLAAGVDRLDPINITKLYVTVPDAAPKFAWQILDAAAAANFNRGSTLCSPWLPVAVFHAALVIWTDVTSRTSKRILLPFIVELQRMGWPCCAALARTIERLMT